MSARVRPPSVLVWPWWSSGRGDGALLPAGLQCRIQQEVHKGFPGYGDLLVVGQAQDLELRGFTGVHGSRRRAPRPFGALARTGSQGLMQAASSSEPPNERGVGMWPKSELGGHNS